MLHIRHFFVQWASRKVGASVTWQHDDTLRPFTATFVIEKDLDKMAISLVVPWRYLATL
jgi:hypothetical protein